MHLPSDQTAQPLPDAASPTPQAVEAAYAMLEPLAGLLLSRQLAYAQAEDLLKLAFVQACARSFAAQGKLPTVSSLSVATGIRRREVKRLLELTPQGVVRPPSAAAQARLRWATDPAFLDDAGQPRRLPRNAPDGQISFASLAASVSKDMHARALLDDLLRINAVEEDGAFVVLRRREYQPSADEGERLRVAGVNVSDHLSAVLVNLLSSPPPLLERALYADCLTQASARHGAELARDAWQQVLGGLRDKLQALAALDEPEPDQQWRVRIGMYAYFAPEDRPAPPVSAKPRARPKAAAKTSKSPKQSP